MENNKVLYRYCQSTNRGLLREFPMVDVYLNEYKVLKETEKSYIINEFGFNDKYGRKVVLKETKDSRVRFAYDTKEAALKNFIKRREKQIRILKDQLSIAEEALKQIMKIKEE